MGVSGSSVIVVATLEIRRPDRNHLEADQPRQFFHVLVIQDLLELLRIHIERPAALSTFPVISFMSSEIPHSSFSPKQTDRLFFPFTNTSKPTPTIRNC